MLSKSTMNLLPNIAPPSRTTGNNALTTTREHRKRRLIALTALILFLVVSGVVEQILTVRLFNGNARSSPSAERRNDCANNNTRHPATPPTTGPEQTELKFRLGNGKTIGWTSRRPSRLKISNGNGSTTILGQTIVERLKAFFSECRPFPSSVCEFLQVDCSSTSVDARPNALCRLIENRLLQVSTNLNDVGCPNRIRIDGRPHVLYFCLDDRRTISSMNVGRDWAFNLQETTRLSVIIDTVGLLF